MSKQEHMQTTAKARRTRQARKLNVSVRKKTQLPANASCEAWKAYWKSRGQQWRTEPGISSERQKYLAERRAIVPDIEKGVYPFKGIKLSRADVEWLLATHENGRGPVDWEDEGQRGRMGLDIRGADLRQVDLSNLPLARLCGGIPKDEWYTFVEQRTMYAATDYAATDEQRVKIAMLMANADLIGAHLEEVNLSGSHLEGVHFCDIHLEGSYLCGAHLEDADLAFAHLKEADLTWAYLRGVDLTGAHLEGIDLNNAELAALSDKQSIGPQLVDTHWGETNLAVVDWLQITKLGEEYEAQKKKTPRNKVKDKVLRLNEHQTAVRANRQLATVLQVQGLDEVATRFAYRAQKLQRIVLRHQKKFGQYIFSGFLDALAGYGYRPGRSVLWYLATILVFAVAYHFLGGLTLYPPDAFVFSVMSFHGRGFFPALSQETNLHNPLVMLAAAEAIIGLLIEISFIATFTQRFFGR